MNLANDVVQQFDENGRLYSTADSIAAISLMRELEAAQIFGLASKAVVNGLECSMVDAYTIPQIETIECVEGAIRCEAMMEVCDEGRGGVPIEVALEKDEEQCRQFHAGDAVDLVIALPEGYRAGDLAWVFLPDALSRVVGGGQSRRFPVDFRGKDQLRIPLAVTSTITFTADGIPGPNHLIVWLRNMFEEERAGTSGPVEFTISIGEPLVFQ
ncbi:MAG: hypothetical protein ACQESR_31190 [Planctomycetota bacterium]